MRLRRKSKVIVFIVFLGELRGELEQRRESYGKGLSLEKKYTPAERRRTGCTHP